MQQQQNEKQLSAVNQKIKQCVGPAKLISSSDKTTLQVVITPVTDVETQAK